MTTTEEVRETAVKNIKESKGFVLASKMPDGKFSVCCTGLTKENISWVITLLQTARLDP